MSELLAHLARQIESDECLLGLPKATFELGVDDERRPCGRQIEGNEGIDLFAACGHAFVSACCALRHVLGAHPGMTSFNGRMQRTLTSPADHTKNEFFTNLRR